LRAHVEALAAESRNVDLERPAGYIERELGASRPQEFQSGGRRVRNIEAGAGRDRDRRALRQRARLARADDNASGVAVLIELRAMGLPARFVAFANEEMPYFQSQEMGSHAWRRAHAAPAEKIDAMLSLEMLGLLPTATMPGSQGYPPPLGWFYPDRANFIAFVGDLGSRSLVQPGDRRISPAGEFPSKA